MRTGIGSLTTGGRGAALAARAVIVLLAAMSLLIGLAAATQVALAGLPDEARQGELATTWTDFWPTGWTNMSPQQAGVTAFNEFTLDPATAEYRYSTDGSVSWTEWSSDGLIVAAPLATTVHFTATGMTMPDSAAANLIEFRIRVTGGSYQTSGTYTVRVDTTAPSPPTNMQHFPGGWTNVNSFLETWTTPADLSGVVGAYYRLDSTPSFPTDGTYVPSPNAIDNIQVATEGAHSILVWLADAAGNIDQQNYRVDLSAFRYDATAPSVGVAATGDPGLNGWYRGDVTLAFSPVDATSGIQSWSWQLDQEPPNTSPVGIVTGDAAHDVLVNAVDLANNVMTPFTYSVGIDGGAPTLTHTVSSEPGDSGWYVAPVTVTFGLTDPVSGPDLVTSTLNDDPAVVGDVVAVGEEGVNALIATGQDVAGNLSQPLALTLRLDSRPPTTTLTLTPPQPQPSGYFTEPVSAQFQAVDAPPGTPSTAVSGVEESWMRIDDGPWQPAGPLQFAADGTSTLVYFSIDVAGNQEISHTEVISVDINPPPAPIAPAVEPAGWTGVNSFTLSWQDPEDASGIAGAWVFIGDGPPASGTGEYYASTTLVTGLAAPAEGSWPVWLSLADGAGHIGAPEPAGALQFDATPPVVTGELAGSAGNNGWYTGPVEATLTLSDTGSGPDFVRYRLDGGPWQQVAGAQVVVPVSDAGKHTLEYDGQDAAGHSAGPAMQTVRIDADPPGPAIMAAITPTTWSRVNQFMLTWRNPADTSGVAYIHISMEPPATAADGVRVNAAEQQVTLQAPVEGAYDLYLWLEDTAGNTSLDDMTTMPEALRFDVTPPTTTVMVTPPSNAAGWWRSDVAAIIETADALSGIAQVTWQVDEQEPVSGVFAQIDGDGEHTFVVRSFDHAGNVRQSEQVIRIDSVPPTARLYALGNYSAQPEIPLRWEGEDPNNPQLSSGLAGYDVQVRVGAAGVWQPWLANTNLTESIYTAERGQTVAFRVRSRDAAGNLSPWSEAGGSNTVFVDPLVNGSFVTNNWDGWNTEDGLQMTIIQETDLQPGMLIPAARLGSRIYQACAASGPNMLPTPLCGDTWSGVSQTITVPGPQDLPNPKLDVWYRVQTYDQITTTSPIWDVECPVNPPPPFRWVDSFDVSATRLGATEPDLLLRDGNSLPQFPEPIEFRDLGWKLATFDLSPYAGQVITLDFASHNRLDNRFNTWTDVTGIRIRGEARRIFMPLANVGSPAQPPEEVVCWPNGAHGLAQTPLPSDMLPGAGEDASQDSPLRSNGR
ncbi:MAG: hypothetical protein R2844_05425 [Caldilineales bacterium]